MLKYLILLLEKLKAYKFDFRKIDLFFLIIVLIKLISTSNYNLQQKQYCKSTIIVRLKTIFIEKIERSSIKKSSNKNKQVVAKQFIF